MLNRLLSLVLTSGLVLAIAGCSDDTATKPPPDKGVVTDGPQSEGIVPPKEGGTDAPVAVDCTGKTDGLECGTGMICLASTCVATMCGDKYVDTKAGEECDDNNADPADGCNACKFNCKADGDCDDKEVCTGTETCDTTAHKCKAGTLATDGTACTLPAGAGKCAAGICLAEGCGNGVTTAPEECDDGNKVDGDGCETTCKFSCKANADCDDGDKCTGAETCDTATHKCKAGTALTCDDAKTCTTDSCDPVTGCVNTPLDADKDGKSCADDCNDADPSVYVGAPECADGKDNDCDGQKDEAPLAAGKCWVDTDKDSYAVDATGMISSCTCPAGYTTRDPALANSKDCNPKNASVNPGQTGWFSTGYCPGGFLCLPTSPKSFDYNCDGNETKRYGGLAGATCSKITFPSGITVCLGSGWTGTAVPACGASADYKNCTLSALTKSCVAKLAIAQKQECH